MVIMVLFSHNEQSHDARPRANSTAKTEPRHPSGVLVYLYTTHQYCAPAGRSIDGEKHGAVWFL